MRPSPSISATSVQPGAQRRGNDDWTYRAVEDKSGKQKWALTPEEAAMRKGWNDVVSFSLRPSVRHLDVEKDKWGKRVFSSDVKYMKQMRIPSFSSPRALQIVWNSLPVSLDRKKGFYAKSVKWNVRSGRYDVVFVFAGAPDAEEFVKTTLPENYGELAADTWMEGNIFITQDHEMNLDLVDVKRKL